jgi:hypothetical protein
MTLLSKLDYPVCQTGTFNFCRQTLGYESDRFSHGNVEIFRAWVLGNATWQCTKGILNPTMEQGDW